MANWNQKTANYIKDQIKTWSEEFFQSEFSKGLVEETGTTLIATFADKMYETHERTPKSWVGYGAKAVVETDFKNQEEAVTYLEAFFQFLNEKAYIKNASALTKAIHEAAPKTTSEETAAPVVKKAPEKKAAAPKPQVQPTSTTTSKNPYNQMVKERNLKNKRLGKKKNRKKRSK